MCFAPHPTAPEEGQKLNPGALPDRGTTGTELNTPCATSHIFVLQTQGRERWLLCDLLHMHDLVHCLLWHTESASANIESWEVVLQKRD